MRVRIIYSEAWHTGLVGQEFNTLEPDNNGFVCVDYPGSKWHHNSLRPKDYEVVAESKPAIKLVEYDGVKYKVPGWTTVLTRDREGDRVFAWEKTPEWISDIGYFNDDSDSRREMVTPYVAPKPDGHFFYYV